MNIRIFFAAVALGLFVQHLPAQQRPSLSGVVTDAETGRPLANAIVLIHDTALMTATNENGEYSLTIPFAGVFVAEVRFIGYTPVRSTVDGKTGGHVRLDIALQPTVLPGQTIVVTATRGRERETPATFSTLSARELASRYSTQDIPQLLSVLPSTTFYSENGNGIGYSHLNIRGFDQQRISVMVNGIPQNDPEDHDVYWLDFPDLAASAQDIQVQRGGGSAFYGPPAIGGSVNVLTSTHSLTPGIEAYAGYGSYATRKVSVSVNSGLVAGRYMISGRLGRIQSDGYRDRSWTDFTSYFLSAVRFDETMTTQVNFYGGPIADHLAYYGIAKEDAYSSDESRRRQNPIARPEEIENFSQPHAELLHEWRIDDRWKVNNTLFLVAGSGFFDFDGSWAPYSYFRLTPTVPGDPDTIFIPNALIRAQVNNTQIGWLPRISWKHADGELTVGAEVRIHRSIHWGSLRWGSGLPADATPDRHYYEYRGAKDMLSLHAQESYRLRDDLTLLLGFQMVHNRYRLYEEKFVGTDFTVPYTFFNPKAGINYNISPATNVYLQVSRTSREPRLKSLYDAAEASTPAAWGRVTPQFASTGTGTYDFSRPFAKPEHLVNVEFGGAYVAGWLRAGANLYWMDFRDEIIKNGQLDRFGVPVTGNAERTRHLGIELTVRLEPVPRLVFDANVTLSRNRLIRYVVYDSVAHALDGNAIAGFPDLLANLRVMYSTSGWTAGVSVQRVGRSFTNNLQDPDDGEVDPERTVDAFSLCNCWCSFTPGGPFGDAVEVQLQVNNVFNLPYASHGEEDQFFPGATRNVFASIKVTL